MEKKEPLTNESIRKKFKSQFDLVNYAIKLTEQMIQTGRGPRVVTENQNPAVIVIQEIEEGKDVLDELQPVDSKIIEKPSFPKMEAIHIPKTPEKKKARRILL